MVAETQQGAELLSPTVKGPEERPLREFISRSWRGRYREVVYALIACAMAACSSCDGCNCGSGRRHWQAPPEPKIEALRKLEGSDVLVAEAARIAARKNRAHTLRIHMDALPVHLDPLAGPTIWTRRITRDTVFESLLRLVPPEGGAGSGPGHYGPGLAKSWTISPSGRVIQIELQPGVTFHDGHKLTSVDVQYTLDRVRSASGPSPQLRRMLADVESVDLATSRGLRIRLSRANGYVLRALAEIPIVPAHIYKHVYEGRGRATRRSPVVGTGPYRLQSWKGDVVTLARRDDYWGAAPAISSIEFVYQSDAAIAVIAAKRDELDIVPALIPEHDPGQAQAPGIASRFKRLELRPTALRYLVMDSAEPPFDDARVRHAIALLLERKAFAQEFHHGQQLPVAGFVWPGGPGDGPSPSPPPYDPAEAYRLLDAAGWRDLDGDGHRERRGLAMQVSLLALETKDAERQRIVASLKRAGMRVVLRRGAVGVLSRRLEAHDFDLALVSWRGVVDDDLSPLLETRGGLNFGQFSDPKIDRIFTELRGSWEPASRSALMGKLAAALVESWPIAPLSRPFPHGLIHRRVRGAVVWNGWISLRDLSLAPPAE